MQLAEVLLDRLDLRLQVRDQVALLLDHIGGCALHEIGIAELRPRRLQMLELLRPLLLQASGFLGLVDQASERHIHLEFRRHMRRRLARLSANVFIQPFFAALLAGVVGALAVRYQLSSSLRLVAVCPCMVLVPGPHFLNGALDLINGRVALGAARLIYAGLIVVAISTGLLLGLTLLGVSLPTDPAGRLVPL